MKRIAGAVAAVSLALGGCQSYGQGVEVICEAPNNCPDCANADPSARMALMARGIDESLSNGKAGELFRALGALPVAERIARLEAEAKAAGLATCPLVEELRKAEAAGGSR